MKKIKIVLVDDNKDVRDMILNIFEDWLELNNLEGAVGFDIREHDNGRHLIEELEKLKEKENWVPDFCCVDYFMDYGNGHYVVKNLERLYPNTNLNIAVVTAWADERDLTYLQSACVVLDKVNLEEVEQFIFAQLDSLVHYSVSVKVS